MQISFLVKSGGMQGVLNIISLILIFFLVLFLAYYTAKFAAKYQKNALSGKSNITVIESFRVGGNKFIAVIKIGNTYYAVGIGKDEITLIDRLNGDELKLPDVEGESTSKKIDFKEILSQIKNKESKDKDEK